MLKVLLCFVLTVSLGLGQDITVENSCPEGAVAEVGPEQFRIYQDTYCFLFTTKARQEYQQAEASCKAHNGTLGMPKTNDINQFFEQAIDELGIDQPLWIGIDDRDSEGDFVYADGTPLDWDNFNPNPFGNRFTASFGDCVAIDNRYGMWSAYRCTHLLIYTDVFRPFICQYKI